MLKIFLWPLSLAGWIIHTVLSIVGGMIGFFIGLAIAIAGGALCATIIGAVIGLPLLLLGLGMMFKSLF